jgi:hypothetical protein
VLNAVFYELPMQELSTFRERVQAVTPDDILRVAQQYVKPDRLSIVLVGNARAFVPQLRSVGFTEFEIIPIEQLDLMSATLRRDRRTAANAFGAFARPAYSPVAYRPVVAPSFSSIMTVAPIAIARQDTPDDPNAAALLRRVIDAKGGLAALKSVRTMVADAETTFQLEQNALPSTTKTYVSYPDKFRVDATVDGQQIVQIYNAGRAWMKDPGGIRDAPGPVRADFAASVRREAIPLLIAASEGRLKVRAPRDEKGVGPGVTVLEVSGDGFQPVKLFVDDRMLIVKQTLVASGPDGRQMLVEEVFSDYRDVNGVQMPFEAEIVHAGRTIMTRTLTNVALNAAVDEQLFERPR